MVSAFTIVVIAVDRWRSVVNTNPRDNNLSYGRVAVVVLIVWILAFTGSNLAENVIVENPCEFAAQRLA